MKLFRHLFAVICVSLTITNVSATEGMFIPALLESIEDDMRLMGLKITAEDIYSVNNGSLKDAIAQFDGGCTSELISSQGLLLTNHHCGYAQIQSHSSVENNYLRDGFWAYSLEEELANPGVVATFVVSIEDVTAQVLKGITEGMDASAKADIMKKNREMLAAQSTEGTNNEAFIRAYDYGNSYFLIVTKTYKDIRLVGAPPSSIGKFGGDTDNWVWPRHTGDFSLFRIYADENNEPAEYNENNRPYEPIRHLNVSLDGVEEGDFTMVYGFPGRTEQYLTASAVDYVINTSNPMRIEFRENSLDIIDRAMRSSEKIRIQYAAKQSRISNAYKKWIGQNGGLIELDALGKKRELQATYAKLANMHGKSEYAENIDAIEAKVAEIRDYKLAREVFIEYYFYGPEIYRFAFGFDNLISNYETLEKEGKLQEAIEKAKGSVKGFYKNYHQPTDEAIFERLSALYLKHMPTQMIPSSFNSVLASSKGNVMRMTSAVYEKTLFTNQAELEKLLASPSAKRFAKLKKDPAYLLAKGQYNSYLSDIRPSYGQIQGEIDDRMKMFVKGLQETFPEKNYWPDANSTLRLTYGKAEGSAPVDGMEYKFFTTAEGILQKNATGHEDFELPEDLKELLEGKVYGQYAHSDGDLRICFTGSNHTTGGNSGSPVLDASGNLIGLNFDRSWESTMSDILFDPGRCRNIMVDIRYVLWVMDVYAGAQNLIDEITFIKGVEEAETEPAMQPETAE